MVIFEVSGKDVSLFEHEAGNHRWQRIPPTEKRGRVQTSSITVAVLSKTTKVAVRVDERDLEITTTKDSGPGGQNRNKLETAVRIKHIPTGVVVTVCDERSQAQNKRKALGELRARLQARADASSRDERDGKRRSQIGKGMRGDKVRTIQVRNDKVINHTNGKKISYSKYRKGQIEGLH